MSGGYGTLYSLSFVSQQEGWAVGDLGSRVLHTTDGGTTWEVQSHDQITWQVSYGVYFERYQAPAPPGQIAPPAQLFGVLVGENGGIARSDSGGDFFGFRASCTTNTLRGVFFETAGRGQVSNASL